MSIFVASHLSAASAAVPESHVEIPVTTSDPLVSIIIPCYNGEAYLEETITSALLQTYRNVEIVVVDDGSTDGSAAVAQKMPVRYVWQKNGGLVASRNRGLQESRGSYVLFLDADDRLRPEAVEVGLRLLSENPECSMTVGDHSFISENGNHLANSQKIFHESAHYEALLRSNFIEMISTVLFRKEVLDEVGGFNGSLRVSEDYDLYLRISRNHQMCCHREVVAEYRMHQNNMSHNSELMLTTTIQVLREHAAYACREPRRLFAFLAGVRRWRKQYGRQLVWELARSYRTLKADKRRKKLMTLVNYYPQGLLMLTLLRLNPGLDKRNAKIIREQVLDPKAFTQRLQAGLNAPQPHAQKRVG